MDTIFAAVRGDQTAIDRLKNLLEEKKNEAERRIRAAAEEAVNKAADEARRRAEEAANKAIQNVIPGGIKLPF
jgi:vacuolar-type H+-ATPase subunit D/Vma8